MIRSRARALVICTIGLWPVRAGASETVLNAAETTPVAVSIAIARGEGRSALSVSDLMRALSRALERSTDLAIAVELSTDEPAASCGERGRIECLVRQLPRENGIAAAQYIFAIGVYGDAEGHSRLSALLIDAEDALAYLERAPSPARSEEIEGELARRSVTSPFATVADAGALDTYFDRLLNEDFRVLLGKKKHGSPLGTIVLRGTPEGTDLRLEDRLIGRTGAGGTVIRKVRPGQRSVTIARAENPRREGVVVESGRTATIIEPAMASAVEPVGWPKTVSIAAGSAVAAAGLGIALYALLAPRSERTIDTCTSAGCPSSSWFATFCELGSPRSDCTRGRGVLAAPLGIAMALGGGLVPLGAWTELDDDHDVPWIALSAGAILGLLTYGAIALLEPRAP